MTVSQARADDGRRAFCVSIDVERDYRTDARLSTRGIDEGLPVFIDLLNSHGIPFDLMISGEIVDRVPREIYLQSEESCALGCHGQRHSPGYLNRLDATTQDAELRHATQAIASRFGRIPHVFRAPNFSANGDTILTLSRLGYRCDSSVLPGRLVRRWRILTSVDHRGAPEDPYTPGIPEFPKPGSSRILEVPVTANPTLAGGPLGLGFLHAYGTMMFLEALSVTSVRYVVFLAHTWEMVSWRQTDPVAPWVREVGDSSPRPFENLISSLNGPEFVNMQEIWRRESRRERDDTLHPRDSNLR